MSETYYFTIDGKERTVTVSDEQKRHIIESGSLFAMFENGVPKDLQEIIEKTSAKLAYGNNEPRRLVTHTNRRNELNAGPADYFIAALSYEALQKRHSFEFPNVIALDRLIKIFHRSLDQFEEVMDSYFSLGTLPKATAIVEQADHLKWQEYQKELSGYFAENDRFNGRVPRICDDLALAYLYRYAQADNRDGLPELKEYAQRFHLANVKAMVDAGLPIAQVAMIYTTFSMEKTTQIAANPRTAQAIAQMLYKAERDGEKKFLDAAKWLSEHLNTNEEMIEKLYKKAENISLEPTDTIAALETKLLNTKAENEIKRIEKRYKKPGFKFKDVTCELKNVGQISEFERYRAYIMEPDDERQVLLGFNADMSVNSCQRLDDAGESAMMHGLLNPRAGFFIIEDKNSGYIKAQAECWELDEDTLIFDNMEFMNDAEVELYRGILKQWLTDSDYKNVRMGTGYNELVYGRNNFRNAGPARPPVTPYECYVISYEEGSEAPILKSEEDAKEKLEKGEITYFDYVYSDSCDHGTSVWLKEDGKLEPYFAQIRISKRDFSVFLDNLGRNLAAATWNYNWIDTLTNQFLENHGIAVLPGDEEYEEESDEEYDEDREENFDDEEYDEDSIPFQ